MTQGKLFETPKSKTYRAIRHDVTRNLQAKNADSLHHPREKINQIERVLKRRIGWGDLSTIEFFAGVGNLTRIYAKYGEVLANEKSKKKFAELKKNTAKEMLVHCNNVDSYIDFHLLIGTKQIFDIVDLDPYGFPTRFFPDIFMLIKKGVLFVTMPKPSVNILNGITATHLNTYFGKQNPDLTEIILQISEWGLCHWRKATIVDCLDLKSVWRLAFEVERVKATDYTGTKNRK